MNVKRRVLIVLIIIGLGIGAAYWYRVTLNDQDESELILYGNVDIREVRLAFNGSEHVSEILVNEGDRVQAGQLLARLHTTRLQASLDRAKAELVAIKAEAHAAKLSYERIRALAARKLASEEEAEEADAKRQAASAHVDAAEAVVAEAEQALKDAQLFAPTDGIIRDRIVEVGDFVTPQTPVLTLALHDPVWIRTYVPETYLGKVKPGILAHIRTDSFPDKVYQGWVGYISPTAEFTPKNVETPELRTRLVYQMRVHVCNPQYELRLGMPATVTIDLEAGPVDTRATPPCTDLPPQTGQ